MANEQSFADHVRTTPDEVPLKPGVNVNAGEHFLRGDDLEPVLRDPLALAMLAAWLNVRVDQLPKDLRAHTCRDTMERWKRVGEAALKFHSELARLSSIPGAN